MKLVSIPIDNKRKPDSFEVGLVESVEEKTISIQVVVGVAVVKPLKINFKFKVNSVFHLIYAHNVEKFNTHIDFNRDYSASMSRVKADKRWNFFVIAFVQNNQLTASFIRMVSGAGDGTGAVGIELPKIGALLGTVLLLSSVVWLAMSSADCLGGGSGGPRSSTDCTGGG